MRKVELPMNLMEVKKKSAKQIERHFKGVANHQRIEILLLVSETSRLNVEQITKNLKKNFKTVSEHTRRLVQAGLLNKEYEGRTVVHILSPMEKSLLGLLNHSKHSNILENVGMFGLEGVKLF